MQRMVFYPPIVQTMDTIKTAVRQVPRSSSCPSPATSIRRYAHRLVFSSCCAKTSTQTLICYYLYSDLIYYEYTCMYHACQL